MTDSIMSQNIYHSFCIILYVDWFGPTTGVRVWVGGMVDDECSTARVCVVKYVPQPMFVSVCVARNVPEPVCFHSDEYATFCV